MSGNLQELRETPIRITIGIAPVDLGRSSKTQVRLQHPTISGRHATLLRVGSGIEVRDLDSRFGTMINGVRIKTAIANVGDKIQFGSALIYRVTAAGLELDRAGRGMTVVLDGIGVVRGAKSLLRSISLTVPADHFAGILGPSGAGKSTLLNCLAGYCAPTEGQLSFDGRQVGKDESIAHRESSGHVPQESIVYDALTVRENLQFAARLRLAQTDSTVTDGKHTEHVDHAIELVGLTAHAEKIASILSGGQRKRLSVAIELLRRPRLLLLDEPTSGLDPASEASLMEQLRFIAGRGTTTICATHFMDNIRLLDSVIVIGLKEGVGRLAYFGSPHTILSTFNCRNFADLYEKLESGGFSPIDSVVVDPSADPIPGHASNRDQERPSTPSGAGAQDLGIASQVDANSLPSVHHHLTLQQTQTIFERSLLLWSRDLRALCIALLVQPIALGSLVCVTQYNLDRGTSLLFFSVVLAIWFGLNNSVRALVSDRKHYVRERIAGLRPEAYLAAKSAMFLCIGAGQILLLWIILSVGSNVVLGDRMPSELANLSDFWWFSILLLAHLGGLALGLLVSTVSRTEDVAVAAQPLLIIPQLLLSVVAIGATNDSYGQDRPMRPLLVTLCSPTEAAKGESRLTGWAQFVDFLSLPLYTRPATLALDLTRGRVPDGYSNWIWVADFLHLMMLVLATWVALLLAFKRTEKVWPKQLGY